MKQQRNKILRFGKFLNHAAVRYITSAFIIVFTGGILYYWRREVSYHSVSLIFLFVISLLPLLNFRPGPIFLSAVISAFIWNYFFIPPAFTLRIGSIEDTLMYIMYFVIATVSSFLISRIRMQQLILDQKEKRTSALYNLARDLSASKSLLDVTRSSVKRLKEIFQAETVFIYAEDENALSKIPHPSSSIEIDEEEWNYAQMIFLSSEKLRREPPHLSDKTFTYYILFTKERKLGVAGLLFPENAIYDDETDSLINAFLTQISIAVEREHLKEINKRNLIIAESEKLYKTLFDSVSHELKTPITTLMGAVSSFRDERVNQNKEIFYRLIDEAEIATERLKRLVENLLDITRLESGVLKLQQDWHSVADLIHSAVNKLHSDGYDLSINCSIDENAGLCFFDYTLIEQSLINILHNSFEYIQPGGMAEIAAKKDANYIIISISDNGPGFPEIDMDNIFNKFYRVPGTKSGGLGLGLSISKGFIEAHGGSLIAEHNTPGGAKFIIKLPVR